MDIEKYYQLSTGVKFKITNIKDNVLTCQLIGKKQKFQFNTKEFNQMLKEKIVEEISVLNSEFTNNNS